MPRLPAEWEPQRAVMLTWPHAETDWAPRLGAVEAVYLDIGRAVAARQRLLVVCRDASHQEQVSRLLGVGGVDPAAVQFAHAPSNDTWARDHGPITVLDDQDRPSLIDFRFNGWGGKYPSGLDDRLTASLHRAGAFGDSPLTHSDLVLEGGAIDSDGHGALLAVRRTIVDTARNPGWSRTEIEAELGRLLGIERILWLEQGALSGDDTDGHIDTLARFCDPGTICHTATDDPDHPDAEGLAAMAAELEALRRADGKPYRLVPLPVPAPIHGDDGGPLPATYANFLIINGAVLMPTYGAAADTVARSRLRALFPEREIVAIPCRELIRQGGSLHCVTMQLPAAGPRPGLA